MWCIYQNFEKWAFTCHLHIVSIQPKLLKVSIHNWRREAWFFHGPVFLEIEHLFANFPSQQPHLLRSILSYELPGVWWISGRKGLRSVYESPTPAVTKYLKPCGLNNKNLLSCSSGSQKSDTGVPQAKVKVWAGLHSSWGRRGRIHFLAFSSFSRPCMSLLVVPSSIFKSSNAASLWPSLPRCISLWLSSLPPASTLKDPCGYIRPDQTVQGHLPVLRSVYQQT